MNQLKEKSVSLNSCLMEDMVNAGEGMHYPLWNCSLKVFQNKTHFSHQMVPRRL